MKKVLVVDDSKDIVSSLVDLLQESDFFVLTANNAMEGIRIAKEDLPDLILCDILMPETNGFDYLEILKNDYSTKEIPVILISAKAEKSDVKLGMELGAEEYFIKPFDSLELLKTINKILDNIHLKNSDGKKDFNN